MRIKSRLLTGIILLVVSIFLIVLGIVLTVSIVFSVIGVPLLIIGVILLIISVFSMAFGTIGDLLELVKKPFKKRKSKIIEVKEKDGVYRKV